MDGRVNRDTGDSAADRALILAEQGIWWDSPLLETACHTVVSSMNGSLAEAGATSLVAPERRTGQGTRSRGLFVRWVYNNGKTGIGVQEHCRIPSLVSTLFNLDNLSTQDVDRAFSASDNTHCGDGADGPREIPTAVRWLTRSAPLSISQGRQTSQDDAH